MLAYLKNLSLFSKKIKGKIFVLSKGTTMLYSAIGQEEIIIFQ